MTAGADLGPRPEMRVRIYERLLRDGRDAAIDDDQVEALAIAWDRVVAAFTWACDNPNQTERKQLLHLAGVAQQQARDAAVKLGLYPRARLTSPRFDADGFDADLLELLGHVPDAIEPSPEGTRR